MPCFRSHGITSVSPFVATRHRKPSRNSRRYAARARRKKLMTSGSGRRPRQESQEGVFDQELPVAAAPDSFERRLEGQEGLGAVPAALERQVAQPPRHVGMDQAG